MWQWRVSLFVLVFATSFLPPSKSTCEETGTAYVKWELAEKAISSAKNLYPNCQNETKDSSNCSLKDRSLAYLNAALDLISEAKSKCVSCPVNKAVFPSDCSDVLAEGFNKSGVYQIWPRVGSALSNDSIHVYCDMVTDGGGWTVIQRRGKFSKQTDFYQDWKTYKSGFGDIKREFWLGNEKIYTLTNQRKYSVRFDLVDVNRDYRYAVYDSFYIGDESSDYILHINDHSGSATDDMQYHNGAKFSAKDKQNDERGPDNACSERFHSAFWFTPGCCTVNLNGKYQPGTDGDEKSIWWYYWKESYECLYSVEIKIRPKN